MRHIPSYSIYPDAVAGGNRAAVMKWTKTVVGYITVVQEQRFRLITDDGRGFLFTLAHDARVDGGTLQNLQEAHARVIVTYTGEPNLESGIAHVVRR